MSSLPTNSDHMPTPRAFVQAAIRRVADYYGIDPALIPSKSRMPQVQAARDAAIVAIRGEFPGISNHVIAQAIGRSYDNVCRRLNRINAEARS